MVDVQIRPSQPGDADTLFESLRPADLAECLAYGDADVLGGIRDSLRRSMLCWTAEIDGELAAVLGVAPINFIGGVGAPWMLGTLVLDAHARILVRETPDYIARMLRAFPHLINFVHAENATSIRWLRRLGFTLHAPQPYGRAGALFRRFELKV